MKEKVKNIAIHLQFRSRNKFSQTINELFLYFLAILLEVVV